MDRYTQAIAASKVPVDEATVKAEVQKILDKAGDYATPETFRFLLQSIDLTTLSSEDSQHSVAEFTRKVNEFDNDYPQYGHVAAICVYSNFAEVVDTELDVEGVDVAVVAGGFPSSQTFTAVKVADVALAVAGGADEVDVVMNLGMLRDKNYEELTDELVELKHTAKDALLKVILETGALRTPHAIREASVLALYSEADFIKTSTGKTPVSATTEAFYVMLKVIERYAAQGRVVGIKPAGGISSVEGALPYFKLVYQILGEKWMNPSLFRIGASRLADALYNASR